MIMQGNTDSEFKIYRLVANRNRKLDETAPPVDINYKIDLSTRLERKETWEKGHLNKIEYYESYNPDTKLYSNIILEVLQSYVYGIDSMIDYRIKDWYYYTEDGQRIWVKGGDDARKYYLSSSSKRAEGRRRRQNVIDSMDINCVGLLLQTGTYVNPLLAIEQGRNFAIKYHSQRDEYIKDGNRETYEDAINSDIEYAWLDVEIAPSMTMRQWAIKELEPPT